MSFIRLAAASLWTTLALFLMLSGLAVLAAVQLFGLRITGGIALYFVIWWTVLFAVLPFGIRSQVETGEIVAGSEPGAPAAPALREKAIWTTILASLILLLAAALLPLSGL
jgi:predicted secreted protein